MLIKFLNKYSYVIVLGLLLLMLVFEFTSAIQESQIIDEGVHLASGYSYLMTGNHRLNPEHPPLIKLLSAATLLYSGPTLPLDHESWLDYEQWSFADRFLYHNQVSADLMLLLGRLPTMFLSLVLGFFIFKWTRDILAKQNKDYASVFGLLALLLYVFDPNIIAHSRYITTDLVAGLFIFIVIYAFGQYLAKLTSKNLIIFALVFALAQMAKYSAILLIPIIIILCLIRYWQKYLKISTKTVLKKALITIIVVGLITGAITIFFYQGESYSLLSGKEFFRADEDPFVDLFQQLEGQGTWGQKISSMAMNAPIPAYAYLRGISLVITHSYSWGHYSYLLGEYSKEGWWYYFIIAFLVKTPLIILLLLLGCLIFIITFNISLSPDSIP